MKKIQFTLTVEEGKQIIALGTCRHRFFKKALSSGKILLKGGTTVSRISEIVTGLPLRISGRITERGTVASLNQPEAPHSIIIEKGSWRNIDQDIVLESQKLDKDDLVVCGANAFDYHRRAALMAGSPGGGNVGMSVSAWYSEGVPVLIVAGLEKMIPGDLDKIIPGSGRRGKDYSWGMAVGLIPIMGELITEIEAVKLLVDVECWSIGSGGLGEAQGSATLEAWGADEEIYKLIDTLKKVKRMNKDISGVRESLTECEPVCEGCRRHLGCSYRSRQI